ISGGDGSRMAMTLPTVEVGTPSLEPSNPKGTNLGNPLVVPVDVDDAESMVKRRLGDEQVGDGCAVPHPMVTGEVPLQTEGAVEDVDWWRDDFEAVVQIRLKCVVVACRPG